MFQQNAFFYPIVYVLADSEDVSELKKIALLQVNFLIFLICEIASYASPMLDNLIVGSIMRAFFFVYMTD